MEYSQVVWHIGTFSETLREKYTEGNIWSLQQRQTARERKSYITFWHTPALAASSLISTCKLYSSTGVTDLHSYSYGCWWKVKDLHIFCHLLCCLSHHTLSSYRRKRYLSVPDLTHSFSLRWKAVTSSNTMRKKLHHIHKARHIPSQAMR